MRSESLSGNTLKEVIYWSYDFENKRRTSGFIEITFKTLFFFVTRAHCIPATTGII